MIKHPGKNCKLLKKLIKLSAEVGSPNGMAPVLKTGGRKPLRGSIPLPTAAKRGWVSKQTALLA